MQIPGLNLLNSDTAPVEADDDHTPASPLSSWHLLLAPQTTHLADNEGAKVVQAITPRSDIANMDHIDSTWAATTVAQADSSNDLSISVPLDSDADPLDVAIAQNSDLSSAEPEIEGQHADSDVERYNSPSEVSSPY